MLYVRADASKKGIFTMRIIRPDGGGYVTRSTKTPNLAEASRIAEDIYDDMRHRHRSSLPVIPKSLSRHFPDNPQFVANSSHTPPPMEEILLCGHPTALI